MYICISNKPLVFFLKLFVVLGKSHWNLRHVRLSIETSPQQRHVDSFWIFLTPEKWPEDIGWYTIASTLEVLCHYFF